jgi:protein TonB
MATPHVSSADRLGLMLFLAAGIHALVILGVTFDVEDLFKPDHQRAPLEITLVHSRSDKAPEQADYLAQANQEGGGNVKEKVRPSSPFPNARPTADRGDAPRTRQATAPPPEPEQEKPVLSTDAQSPVKVRKNPPEPPIPEQPVPEASELVARKSRG